MGTQKKNKIKIRDATTPRPPRASQTSPTRWKIPPSNWKSWNSVLHAARFMVWIPGAEFPISPPAPQPCQPPLPSCSSDSSCPQGIRATGTKLSHGATEEFRKPTAWRGKKRLNSWLKPALTPPQPLSSAWLRVPGTQHIPRFFPEGGSCFLLCYNGQKN